SSRMPPSVTDAGLSCAVFEACFQRREVARDVAAHDQSQERTCNAKEASGIAPCPDARERAAVLFAELVPDSHRKRLVDAQVDDAVAVTRGNAVLVRELPAEEVRDALDARSGTKRAVRERTAGNDSGRPVGIVARVKHVSGDSGG